MGAPVGLLRPLAHAARGVGGVELVLGWYAGPRISFPADAFPVVRGYMGGFGLAGEPRVRLAPVRLATLPALLAGPWRPDLLLVAVADTPAGLRHGLEVAWLPAAMRAATHVVAELNHQLPVTAPELELACPVEVVAEVDRPAATLPAVRHSAVGDAIGRLVAGLVEPGASVQHGPGLVGDAALRALEVPVHIDSGMVGDPVLDLDRRGLLLPTPTGAYVAGSPELYQWAHGRQLTRALEYTHDPGRLSRLPLVAINSALEVDLTGQVNVESAAGRVVAGIGGHPDYAGAASRAVRGLSIIALPTTRAGRPTLVEQLSAPVSTARTDVDVVVTELGVADLRGRSDVERGEALRRIW